MIRRGYNALGCWAAARRPNPWLDEQALWGIIIFFTRIFGG